MKSTGSFSIEEEEDNLAQISLEKEEYIEEEKQELDIFLETAEELSQEACNESTKDHLDLDLKGHLNISFSFTKSFEWSWIVPDVNRDSVSPSPMSSENLVLEKTEEVQASYITTPVDASSHPVGSTTDDNENSWHVLQCIRFHKLLLVTIFL